MIKKAKHKAINQTLKRRGTLNMQNQMISQKKLRKLLDKTISEEYQAKI